MAANRRTRCLVLALLSLWPTALAAQTGTYYLHNENSSTPALLQLKTAVPDSALATAQGSDLKGRTPPFAETLRLFDTQAGVPNRIGEIPGNSTLTFTFWMRKTALFGTAVPQATVRLNNSSGALLCQATGTAAISTTTLAPYVFSCTTGSSVTLTATDRFWLAAGYNMTAGPGNKSVRVVLGYEGTTTSRVEVPLPPPLSITSVNPTSGPVNWSVTIAGTSFGATQGTSTVKFNGTTATPTGWSNTQIVAPVPSAATTGPVVVTVAGTPSNGVSFTVIPPPTLTSVSPTAAHVGDTVTIVGTNFLQTQGTSTLTFFNGVVSTPSTWNDTTITTPVPSGARTGPVVVTVSAQPSNTLPLTVILPGTISGTVTKASDSSPLAGATVQAVFQGVIKSTATTAANGTYSLPNLDPGTYHVRVHASGYSSEVHSSTVVAETTTPVNVAMSRPGSISGTVTASSGGAPVSGAAVAVFLGGIQKGTTQTNASGAYSIANLHPGAYTVQAASVGYRTREQGATIVEDTNTTSNLVLDPPGTGPVTYAYDELGRLVMVVDPSGDAATYSYDAVGNILSIGRIGAGTVAITEFTPNSSPVGTTVTIFGTGFSPTAAENGVTFNGVGATVTSSTPTRLVTSVPAGATTGPVGVSAPGGAATSATNFIVTAGSGAPTISGFTPTMTTAGSALTIQGTNFDPVSSNNRVTANVAFVTPTSVSGTSIAATVPSAGTSGPLRVSTPAGTATSASDLFIVPPPFTPSDVEFTDRMGYGINESTTVALPTAGKIGLVLFDSEVNRRVSVLIDSAIGSATVKVFRASGAVLAQRTFFLGTTLVEPQPVFQTGTHSILIDPDGTFTGSATLTLYDVVDVTGPITPGGDPVTANLSTPGQNARYTLAGTQNQRVSMTISPGPSGNVTIIKPDGFSTLVSDSIGLFDRFIDTQVLPETGNYGVLADPLNAATGSVTLTLHNVPADLTGTLTINDPAQTVAIDTPGQNADYTFTGSEAQSVRVVVANNTYASTIFGVCVAVRLMQGATELASQSSCASTFELPPVSLPPGGNYHVAVDPQSNASGALALRVVSP